ncbi:hypothetical protein L7F22_034338 [Adiantum nelumboides]|nr:hypothetical protein [Adiantum nelumboides]
MRLQLELRPGPTGRQEATSPPPWFMGAWPVAGGGGSSAPRLPLFAALGRLLPFGVARGRAQNARARPLFSPRQGLAKFCARLPHALSCQGWEKRGQRSATPPPSAPSFQVRWHRQLLLSLRPALGLLWRGWALPVPTPLPVSSAKPGLLSELRVSGQPQPLLPFLACCYTHKVRQATPPPPPPPPPPFLAAPLYNTGRHELAQQGAVCLLLALLRPSQGLQQRSCAPFLFFIIMGRVGCGPSPSTEMCTNAHHGPGRLSALFLPLSHVAGGGYGRLALFLKHKRGGQALATPAQSSSLPFKGWTANCARSFLYVS